MGGEEGGRRDVFEGLVWGDTVFHSCPHPILFNRECGQCAVATNWCVVPIGREQDGGSHEAMCRSACRVPSVVGGSVSVGTAGRSMNVVLVVGECWGVEG